ncbi:hypothetical protein [Roseovarius sp. M141]|uniref:hypothetical protein n=1 Tax=Roseovarius sp. M141 TaxID=2583806 RepID=UPI0020CC1EC5|nr:hypothetical protein [Roseovarius sp. M141]MCQ0091617.1 hypothetical protein [Roseovarius sp. M141]
MIEQPNQLFDRVPRYGIVETVADLPERGALACEELSRIFDGIFQNIFTGFVVQIVNVHGDLLAQTDDVQSARFDFIDVVKTAGAGEIPAVWSGPHYCGADQEERCGRLIWAAQ